MEKCERTKRSNEGGEGRIKEREKDVKVQQEYVLTPGEYMHPLSNIRD